MASVFIQVQSCAFLSGFPGAQGRETYPTFRASPLSSLLGLLALQSLQQCVEFLGTDQSSSLEGSQTQALKGNGIQGDFD